MKVSDVFYRSLSLMSEESDDMYRPFVLHGIAQVMADTLYLSGLDAVPVLSSLEDVIPFPVKLVDACFAYGLCVYLTMGDDEYSKAGFFDDRYRQAIAQYEQSFGASVEKVSDVYHVSEW